ncbi:MAG: hypothetical protein ACI9YO_001164 [Gammaproteobacteria bacterium]|jgi:hypothetical protein
MPAGNQEYLLLINNRFSVFASSVVHRPTTLRIRNILLLKTAIT